MEPGGTDREGRINLTRCCEHYSEVVGLCYLRFPLADGLVDDSNAAREKAFGWTFFSFEKELIAGFPRALIGGLLMTEVGRARDGMEGGLRVDVNVGGRVDGGGGWSGYELCACLFPVSRYRVASLDGEMPFSRCGSFLPCQPRWYISGLPFGGRDRVWSMQPSRLVNAADLAPTACLEAQQKNIMEVFESMTEDR